MRDFFAKDFYWKAFSILMAIGIWLTVHRLSEEPDKQLAGTPDVTNTYDLQLVAVSANADVRRAALLPQTVNATIGGPPDLMNRLTAAQIHAFVDLTGMNSARNLPCDVEVALPPGVTVVDLNPRQVAVTMSKEP